MKNWQDIEGWFDFQDIYDEAVASSKDGDIFVEIGVYKAKSTCYMLEKIKESGKEIVFFAVDDFSMSPKVDAIANILECGFTAEDIILKKENSDTSAENFLDNSVSFCFIDGSHSYNQVKKDIEAWMPKIKRGGILAGHDYQYVKNAVHEVLGDVSVSKSSWIKQKNDMSKSLAGVMFVYNGIKHDYCFEESIESMSAICDKVFVVDAGSDDGTKEKLLSIENPKLKLICTTPSVWHSHKGKEKLSYFTNIAIGEAQNEGYDYVLSVQADEVLHEKSHDAIKRAIESGGEGFLIKRVNLWGSPYTQLVVPENRQPCSTAVIRLTRSGYRAWDDAESINALASVDILSEATIYHMGFVRKREVMVEKIRHMQAEIFGVTPDAKLNGMVFFDPFKWFDKLDVELISERLPVYVEDWAKERVYK